jgi:hypothetical protein
MSQPLLPRLFVRQSKVSPIPRSKEANVDNLDAHRPAGLVLSKKYNASAGETTIELIVVPQGKLGIDVLSVLIRNTKVCNVVNKNNPTSLLEVGESSLLSMVSI